MSELQRRRCHLKFTGNQLNITFTTSVVLVSGMAWPPRSCWRKHRRGVGGRHAQVVMGPGGPGGPGGQEGACPQPSGG